jgi:hypothetical protein
MHLCDRHMSAAELVQLVRLATVHLAAVLMQQRSRHGPLHPDEVHVQQCGLCWAYAAMWMRTMRLCDTCLTMYIYTTVHQQYICTNVQQEGHCVCVRDAAHPLCSVPVSCTAADARCDARHMLHALLLVALISMPHMFAAAAG